MPKFSLIATDLDGTLFYDRAHITDRDRAALVRVREMGVVPVIATGRELEATTPALDRLGLWPYFDYIIYAGGAAYYNVAARRSRDLGMLSVETLHAICTRYTGRGPALVLPRNGCLYTTEATDLLRQEAALLSAGLVEAPDLRTVIDAPATKIVLNGTVEQIESVLPAALADPDPAYAWHRSHDNYIDCYAREVDKGAALRALCEALSIDCAQTLAIGDTENDLALLAAAGLSACPADGTPETRAAADYVTCPAHEGAFADLCETYLFPAES